MAYPTLDVFVLAALIRLFLVPQQRNPALIVLGSAMLLFLLIDLTYNYVYITGSEIDTEAPWLVALGLMTLWALMPGARGLPPTFHMTSLRCEQASLRWPCCCARS